jgi:DNA-directed RNA polymerase specialized sigma24 family protein
MQSSPKLKLSDSDLLDRIAYGDKGAMDSIYARHSILVYSVALRVCRNSISAEEVLDKTFMQMWLKPKSFASTLEGLEGKLGLLSRNLAIELMRRLDSIASREPSTDTPRGELINNGEGCPLSHRPHASMALPEDEDREILEMMFFDGKTQIQVAEETGLSISTIGMRLGRALSVLRNSVRSQHQLTNKR